MKREINYVCLIFYFSVCLINNLSGQKGCEIPTEETLGNVNITICKYSHWGYPGVWCNPLATPCVPATTNPGPED